MEDKKPILYLNMILKETEPVEIVKRSIDSVKNHVDGMYITVTYKDQEPGSSSSLVKLLKDYEANISYFKWVKRFDLARQFALDQLPRGDNIFMYWQDADDVLRGAELLPTLIKEMIEFQQTAVYLRYWYMVELDENGDVKEVIIEHKRERIIRNDGTWKWVGDLHETLIEQRHDNLLRIYKDNPIVIHLSNPERGEEALKRNIEILESQMEREKEKDPRTLVYLGKAYFDRAKMGKEGRDENVKKALTLFHKYLQGSGVPGSEGYTEASGWREERATAWAHVGEIAILEKRPEVSVQAFQSAIDEGYEFPNYYVDLAMAYTLIGDFKRARHWLSVGTSIPMPETTIITFPKELKTRALQVAFEINLNEQKLKEAKENAEMLFELTPKDPIAIENLRVSTELLEFNRACQSIVFLGKYLEKTGNKEQLVSLVRSIPKEMETEKFAIQMKHAFLPKKVWEKNEIAILCGPSFEKWSPRSVDSGIGGSEEAVIRMAQEWTKLGWKVTVYSDAREDVGEYDGVQYRPWYEINYKDSFNVLILWRSIGFIDINPDAKFIMLWLHDVPENPEFTKKRVDKVDKIAVLSDYHKSLLRIDDDGKFIKPDESKIFVTSNGIVPLDVEWRGNPHRLIYMSSPDRGLPYLLNNWSKIKKEVPDAELHVFYGFDVFDAIYKGNPAKMQWKQDILKMMRQKDIVYHARVGHDALHHEIAKSGIWAYPTDFQEISCISAMKAQALGAIPVVTNYAALTETVRNGYKVDVDIRTKEGQGEYFKSLIGLMKDTKKQEDFRKDMIPWARGYFLWSIVARKWDELLRVNLQNPEKRLESK